MNLEQITIAIRPRNPWEAIDLGFAIARRWFLPLWLLWWIGAIPVYLIGLFFLHQHSGWLYLLIWWAKPFYEPPLLFWLSRVIFAEQPSWREMGKRWFSIVRPRLLTNLSWQRLHPSRSFVMPVALLERLTGANRTERLRLLNHNQQASFWLTLIGAHFEIVLELSFIALLWIMLPEPLQWLDLETFLFAPDWLTERLLEGVALLTMSLIAPFYVAAGFALYLMRRTELEAWDLELRFRQLATKL